jgi:hypothetical protein
MNQSLLVDKGAGMAATPPPHLKISAAQDAALKTMASRYGE